MATKLLDSILKTNAVKRIAQIVGVRKPFVQQEKTNHHRMPLLESNGNYLALKRYEGPEVNESEWMDLEYTTYPSDLTTYFAPLTSATGEVMLQGFWKYGKTDKDGVWTANADKAPNLKKWVEKVEANYGRVQLLKMEPNSLREARWGLHLDDNNRLNPEGTGWVVRVWLELTDDPESYMVLRKNEFGKEVKIALPKYSQLVVDSEHLFHGVWHNGTKTRYGLIASFESCENLEKWLESQLPEGFTKNPSWD